MSAAFNRTPSLPHSSIPPFLHIALSQIPSKKKRPAAAKQQGFFR